MIVKVKDTRQVEPLFHNWQETIISSCLQNKMGEIYANSLEKPLSAMAILGDFCFFAGGPDEGVLMVVLSFR